MNVIVIEDESLSAKRLRSQLEKYDPGVKVVAELASVQGALAWFDSHPDEHVDLLFLDIHLEDGDSFEILSTLKLNLPVIFTTAFDDYLIRAFKFNSIDYLLKPINFEELSAALDKYHSLQKDRQSGWTQEVAALLQQMGRREAPVYKDRFMITVGTRIHSVRVADIAYFHLDDKVVSLVTNGGTSLPLDYSLEKLLQVLDPRQFFRVNRQFIISLGAMQVVHTHPSGVLRLSVTPAPRQEVTVSGDRVAEFKKWLGKD